MKKWIKNWWFSILCFAIALGISIFVFIGNILLANDDFIYALLMINCLSPVLLLIIIGIANQPKKEK